MFKLFKNKFFWLVLIIVPFSIWTMIQTPTDRASITIFEKAIRGAYTPLQSKVIGFSMNSSNGVNLLFSDKRALNNRIQELEKENSQLRLDNQVLRENTAEVKRLRHLLDFKAVFIDTFDLLPARVIARSPNNWHKMLTIDKGAQQGIKSGMSVISPDGLVGYIKSVDKNSSRVSLITDRETAVGAILQETRDTKGIVEGIGNAHNLRMVNIPYYAEIKRDENVVTSGLSNIYPKGISIGTITKVIKEPDGLLLSANVKPAVDFDKLEEIFVITKYFSEEDNMNSQGED